jgi:hypothetical protein
VLGKVANIELAAYAARRNEPQGPPMPAGYGQGYAVQPSGGGGMSTKTMVIAGGVGLAVVLVVLLVRR